ncbi:MAG: adenosylmethionine decarboxylase [Candidatus Pacebacteria bacterium]|nr:adenosylmethionine decarboxylase [Candidatus Paceibacterota bacterium]
MKKNITTGLHILGEVFTKENSTLTDLPFIKNKILKLIEEIGLSNVGFTAHEFAGGGFTLIIALAESHFSIHTWPEMNYATLDVFVCNIDKDNTLLAKMFFNRVVKLLNPKSITQREIIR